MNKIVQIELPAYWASALVNGDWSGIEGNIHEGELLDWIDSNPNVNVIMCSDNSYIGRYDGLICDMLTYDIEVRLS